MFLRVSYRDYSKKNILNSYHDSCYLFCYNIVMLYEKRIGRMDSALEKKQPTLSLFFESVSSSQNLSAIIRSAESVGVVELFYSTKESCALKMHKTITQGAHRWVKVTQIEEREKIDFLKEMKKSGFQLVVTGFGEDASSFREIDYTQATLIIVGNERVGVSCAVQALADEIVMIPMFGMVQSLNVSVASALILYEAQAQREKKGFYKREQMSQENRDKLKASWLRRDVIVRRSKGRINK
jgi:tRNA (guanosine-2'-O-)-methyltransferase